MDLLSPSHNKILQLNLSSSKPATSDANVGIQSRYIPVDSEGKCSIDRRSWIKNRLNAMDEPEEKVDEFLQVLDSEFCNFLLNERTSMLSGSLRRLADLDFEVWLDLDFDLLGEEKDSSHHSDTQSTSDGGLIMQLQLLELEDSQKARKNSPSQISTSPSSALLPIWRILDTLILKLLVLHNDSRWKELLAKRLLPLEENSSVGKRNSAESQQLVCRIRDVESFLKEHNRWGALALMYKRYNQIDEALIYLRDLVLKEENKETSSVHSSSSYLSKEEALEQIVLCLTSLYSQTQNVPGRSLLTKIREYSPFVLSRAPALGVSIFMRQFSDPPSHGSSNQWNSSLLQRVPIAADDVLEVLSQFAPSDRPMCPLGLDLPPCERLRMTNENNVTSELLATVYLEFLVYHQGCADSPQKTQLGLLLARRALDSVETNSEAKLLDCTELAPERSDLLRFLVLVEGFNAHAIVEKIQRSPLVEEQLVLMAKMNRHEQALRLLTHQLKDVESAKVYCLALSSVAVSIKSKDEETGSPGGDATRTVVVDSNSEATCRPQDRADLPRFTSPYIALSKPFSAFAYWKEILATESSNVSALSIARVESHGRLLTLLQALVAGWQCFESPADKTFFRNGACDILNNFASHPDLPPSDVMSVLPDNWPVEGVLPLLMNSLKREMHSWVTLQIQGNLSSMAFLQTHARWTAASRRSITITSDKVCAVCTRRIGDRAFVVTPPPNITCVHLHCTSLNA